MGVAVEYLLSLGQEWVWERVQTLAAELRRQLAGVTGVTLQDRGRVLCGIVSFVVVCTLFYTYISDNILCITLSRLRTGATCCVASSASSWYVLFSTFYISITFRASQCHALGQVPRAVWHHQLSHGTYSFLHFTFPKHSVHHSVTPQDRCLVLCGLVSIVVVRTHGPPRLLSSRDLSSVPGFSCWTGGLSCGA